MRKIAGVAFLVFAILFLAACGASKSTTQDNHRATIVVTTAVLGDVVQELVGDVVQVVTIMPNGVSPHDFQASARQVEAMQSADLLVVNGGGFEEGLLKVVETAAEGGVPVFRALDHAQPLDYHGDAAHEDDDHDEGNDQDHGHSHTTGLDPHFFTDPARMVLVAEAFLAELSQSFPDLVDAEVQNNAQTYLNELRGLEEEVAQLLSVIPSGDRKMVTNHGVFGYFANRYSFRIVDTIIPGGGLSEGVGAERLARLVETIQAEEVSVIFVDRGASDRFAGVLQGELPGLRMVELYSETLGEPDSGAATYLEMIRSNATAIAQALASTP